MKRIVWCVTLFALMMLAGCGSAADTGSQSVPQETEQENSFNPFADDDYQEDEFDEDDYDDDYDDDDEFDDGDDELKNPHGQLLL